MMLSRMRVAALFTLTGLARSRVSVLLFFAVPALLVGVVTLTADASGSFGFGVPAASSDLMLFATPRDLSLIFVALAAVGLLSSFVALRMMQREALVHRRLIVCGFPALELLLSKLGAVLLIDLLAAGYVTVLSLPFVSHFPVDPLGLWVGLSLGGLVYGAYGLLMGALLDDELEGILAIALLVNLDAGWLQNPVYYAEAQRTALLKVMPAYFPSQVALSATFSELAWWLVALEGAAYAVVLLGLAAGVFKLRASVASRRR